MNPTKPIRRAIHVVQIGAQGLYRVEKTTNFLDLKLGKNITREEIEKHMADGVTIYVSRNK